MEQFSCEKCGFKSRGKRGIVDPDKHENLHRILDLLEELSIEEIEFVQMYAEDMSEEWFDEDFKLRPEWYDPERIIEDLEKKQKEKEKDE